MNDNNIYYRYRVKFGRRRPANMLSHLKHINCVRNIVISASLEYVPLKPKKLDLPKISFGPALTVGYESTCEYADIYLKNPISNTVLFEKISDAAQVGYSVIEIKRIPYHFPSVEALVNIAEYDIKTGFELVSDAVEKFLNMPEIFIKKIKSSGEEKILNAKPLILSMKAYLANHINLLLEFGPGKNIKPHLIIENLTSKSDISVLRKNLYWKNKKGALISP
jgi:radical SAM-linked protein